MIQCLSELESEYISYRSRRFPDEYTWLTGNCFQYACILREWLLLHCVASRLVYDIISGHFLVISELPMNRNDTVLFSFVLDYTGVVVIHPGFINVLGEIFYHDGKHFLVDWDYYAEIEPLNWSRICSYCCC